MITNNCICDQCKQPIDPANGKISLQPVRGGLTILIANAQGSASKAVNQQVDLCDQECLGDWVKAIGTAAKATTATAAPTAPGTK